MNNGLILYPISIYDYNYFKQLAMGYIVLDVASKNNLARQEFIKNRRSGLIPRTQKYKKLIYKNLFDLLILLIENDSKIKMIKENKEDTIKMRELYKDNEQVINFINMAEKSQYQDILNGILKLFYMVTNIVPKYINEEFIFDIDNDIKINRDNFYEFRDIVMKQNLLFEPRVAPDPESQAIIDRELERKNGSGEFDIEAVISFVSTNCGGADLSNCTYYRLMCDYSAILRSKGYDTTSVYRANGCKMEGDRDIPYPDISEHLPIKDNPYSRENIYRASQLTEFDKKLMKNK
jgi:hypothetical protein